MRILFDTNVVLDVLLDRKPHSESAAALLTHVERRRIEVLLAATTVTTIHYVAAKAVGASRARKLLQGLLSLFEVAPVDGKVLAAAMSLGLPDLEDAVLHEAARHAGATAIVTRDPRGFARSKLPVHAPRELLDMFETIAEGLSDAEAGRVVDHDKVAKWLASWGSDRERKPPR